VSDRRYSTARWQRLRRAVLAHYGYVCQVEGPRCTGYATTVHHLVPSSQAPHLFWEPSNLVAACRRCNYGDGARVAAENTRETIAKLRALVWEQQAEIGKLRDRLKRHEDVDRVKRRRTLRSTDKRMMNGLRCARSRPEPGAAWGRRPSALRAALRREPARSAAELRLVQLQKFARSVLLSSRQTLRE
jgi:HNH endonuclease